MGRDVVLAAVDGQWAIGGGLGAVALIGLIRFLLGDREATAILEREIRGLSEALQREREDRRQDIRRLTDEIATVQASANEQRTEKHRLISESIALKTLLGVIVDLAEKCSCGSLDVVRDLMERAASIPIRPDG